MRWRRERINPRRKKQNPVKRPASAMVNLLNGAAKEEDREVPHQANCIVKSQEDKESKHGILSTHSY
jgi:hypothetical protein